MRAGFSTNAKEIAERYLRRARAVDGDQGSANRIIAEVLTRASKENLQDDVYGVPLKFTSRGRPRWRRTGRLYREDQWVIRGRAVVHRNAARHYKARLAYGQPGGREAKPPQKVWRGPKFVLGAHRSLIRRIRREAFQRSLRTR